MVGMMLVDLPLSEVVVVSEVVNMSHCGVARHVFFGLGMSIIIAALVFNSGISVVAVFVAT